MSDSAAGEQRDFDGYWLSYLSAHRRRGTRALHYVGTVIGVFGGILLALIVDIRIGLGVAIGGYALALAGHFLIERNRPHATKPLWGVFADFRMLKRAITGELAADLDKLPPSQRHG